MNQSTIASASEQRTSARIGAVLFRNRSWLPVPFLLVALLAPGSATAVNWLIGAVLIVVGEWVRLAGVAAAGTTTRRRSRNVQRLVTYGREPAVELIIRRGEQIDFQSIVNTLSSSIQSGLAPATAQCTDRVEFPAG